VANKKCPKCGEDNPAEAVMCWACYTPLSGAAPLTAGAAALPATAGAPGQIGAPGVDVGSEKKGLDPKAIGIGAVLLVGLAVAGFVTFGMGGGTTDTGTMDTPTVVGETNGGGAVPAPQPPAATGPAVPMPAPGAGAQPVAAVPLPFQTVSQPNPNSKTGTVGIIANEPNLAPAKAIGLAKAARQQYAAGGRWQNMQVAVFSNAASAKAFQTYQAGRKNAPLGPNDYQSMGAAVWSGASAFYETVGRTEYSYYPSRNPTAWWGRR
jgi:hypothetical protein